LLYLLSHRTKQLQETLNALVDAQNEEIENLKRKQAATQADLDRTKSQLASAEAKAAEAGALATSAVGEKDRLQAERDALAARVKVLEDKVAELTMELHLARAQQTKQP